MINREKIIKGLECCSAMSGYVCRQCPYSDDCIDVELAYGIPHLAADALELLKAQEPRVLTLEELRQLEHTDHIIWIEANGDPESFNGYAEVTTNFVTKDIEFFVPGNEIEFMPDNKNYGKTWRCWTSRPTDEQREVIPWRK